MIDPFIGKTIGKYEIVEHIGRGATADVYKAYQPTLDRYVAIKLLHPFLAEDTDFLERFQREAKAVARLRHPNIMQVYDFDVIQDIYYLVMEHIDGITLKSMLQALATTEQIMPLTEAVRITRCVANALAYAHTRDMIHRDIKPANIMIDHDNQVILTDFGTAKILSGGQHTASGVTTGTPAYASPEQVMALPGDPRSDIYSLGIVFFQLVTGQLPYDADTGVAVFLKHLTDPIPSPRAINSALSIDVETIIFRAMAKKPENRYRTADEFIVDLDRIVRGLTVPDAVRTSFDTAPLDLSRYANTIAFEPLAPEAVPAYMAPALRLSSFQLPPYTLSPGNVITEPSDLPNACLADWSRAVSHFVKGYITTWLREGVSRLRAAHQHGLADDLEVIASGAEGIVQHISSDDDQARNAALQEFLISLGAAPPALHVTPDRIEVAPLGAEEIGEPITLTIINRDRGYLFGQVRSHVPWLKVTHAYFGCVAGEQSIITLQPNAIGLTSGRIEASQAIIIHSIGGERRLPAQIDVLPAVLQTDAGTLEFGTVGQGATARCRFSLVNRGQGYLVGTLRSLQPWLSLSTDRFSIPSRGNLQLEVTVDPQSLPAGAASVERAVLIDSNGGRLIMGANLRVHPPHLKLDPPTIDFGVIDLALPNAGKNAEITITNNGPGVLMGVLKPEADWLSIEPAAFRCVTGQTQRAKVATTRLKTGDFNQFVRLISNAGDANLPIHLHVAFSLEPETIVIAAGPFYRGSQGYSEDEPPVVNSQPENAFSKAFKPEPRRARSKEIPLAEQPQREIYLSEYAIGRYLVTNAEYAVFITASHRRPPAHWIDGVPPIGRENHPVVNVTWWDAVAYCKWLSEVTDKAYRLPTEAQWEKAARGTDKRMYPWGQRFDRNKCNTLEGGARSTLPVGSFSPDGDSCHGCADMAGNVWEWMLDWYSKDYYAHSTADENPLGPVNGAVKVMRGGSFNTDAWQARTTNRSYANRNLASSEVGFRVALQN
jgi:serine/threonine protein kinase/formylglycine-generating enzyme required for sulfatase activity